LISLERQHLHWWARQIELKTVHIVLTETWSQKTLARVSKKLTEMKEKSITKLDKEKRGEFTQTHSLWSTPFSNLNIIWRHHHCAARPTALHNARTAESVVVLGAHPQWPYRRP
jgi:hypothetical protein